MNLSQFVAKWKQSTLTERSAAQQHFLDLCELIGHPKPASLDPTGESFTFEKRLCNPCIKPRTSSGAR